MYQTLNQQWRRDDAAEYLAQLVIAANPLAIAFRNQLELFTADMIVVHSFAARVHDFSRSLSNDYLFGDEAPILEEEVVELENFGNEVKPIVRRVNAWAAKSAATFHTAIDCLDELQDEVVNYRFLPNEIIRRRMRMRILDRHAFDKGDNRSIEILALARNRILTNLPSCLPFSEENDVGEYMQLDSSTSYLVQAADIAAGIASRTLETEGLTEVSRIFEYVTYNGRRISVSDAEEEMRMPYWHRPSTS